jgi:hypothetical protein
MSLGVAFLGGGIKIVLYALIVMNLLTHKETRERVRWQRWRPPDVGR